MENKPLSKKTNWALAMLLALAGTGMEPIWSQPVAQDSPALIELFTSQGCSSCPPAEAVLNTWGMELFNSGKALPLAFHVDYWDNLGWKDPFSSALFTARQSMYAKSLGDPSLYTPEMVVEGRVGFVGSDLSRAQKEISLPANPSANVAFACRLASHSVTVKTTASFPSANTAGPGLSPGFYAVVFENGLSTDVTGGENQGRHLTENFVVRNLKELETSENNGVFIGQVVVPLEPNWVQSRLGVAVFAQDKATQKILAVRWVYPLSRK
jgi:hypothetical protein